MKATLNTVGLRCPSCAARLVSRESRYYRCTNRECDRLYRLSVDPDHGILLTLTEERHRRKATDGPSTTSLALPQFTTPRLSFVGEEARSAPLTRAADC